MSEANGCPFCGTPCKSDQTYWGRRLEFTAVDCKQCGRFGANEHALEHFVSQRKQEAVRLSVLLHESNLNIRRNLPVLLEFTDGGTLPDCLNTSGEVYAHPIRVSELLATWPTSVPDQIDRAIRLLALRFPKTGQVILAEDNGVVLPPHWLVAEDKDGATYLREHLLSTGWLEDRGGGPKGHSLRITPKGWARVGELTRRSARTNPVFVAMWFGGLDKVEVMTSRYEKAIYPAIKAVGYNAHRSDRDEHNEGIMDRIRFDIQRAPFVVADSTDHNQGVYYEAGLASGHGVEVIHCCPKDEFKEKHFDIAHRNLIKYTDDNDLRVRLEHRILGSIGEGPFPKERGSKAE